MLERLKAWAQRLKQEVIALWFAYRHPDTPWYARAFAALVVAYAFSPIDLIPDFIPILGLLDDALLVPLGIWVAVKLIPPHVYAAAREQARALRDDREVRPRSLIMAAVIVTLWITAAAFCSIWAWRAFAL